MKMLLYQSGRQLNIVLLSTFVYIAASSNVKFISSETGRSKLSKYWTTCPNSWKYIYGNWEICSETINKRNCLLKTEYYPLKENINRIFINIMAIFPRSCKKELKCNALFNILYKFNDNENYNKLETVNSSSEKYYYKREKIQLSLDLTKPQKGIYLAFEYENGSCVSITELELYYKECSTFSAEHLTKFYLHNAPSSSNTKVINGKCVDNAVSYYVDKYDDILIQSCTSDGDIQFNGSCKCMMGYEKKSNLCQLCQLGRYKESVGNGKCRPCGANTFQAEGKREKCKCLPNYFKIPSEESDHSKPCFTIGGIKDFLYSNNTDSSVVLTWQPTFNHIENPEIYVVKINGTSYQEHRNRRLYFRSTNFTQTFDIEIFARAEINGRVYRGPIFRKSFFVHENKYLSHGKINYDEFESTKNSKLLSCYFLPFTAMVNASILSWLITICIVVYFYADVNMT